MNDHIAGEDLAAYVEGALKGVAKAGIEAHLSHCPECLEALADIVAIRDGGVKIPAEFLRRALKVPDEGALKAPVEGVLKVPRRMGTLGEKEVPARMALPMRLVLGAAAVFLVAVVLGYFFLGGNRSARTGNAQKEGSGLSAEKAVPEKSVKTGEPVPIAVGKAGPAAAPVDAKARRKQLEKEAAAPPSWPKEVGKKAAPAAAPAGALPTLVDDELKLEQVREQEHLVGEVQAQAEKDKSTAMNMAAAQAAAPAPRLEADATKEEADAGEVAAGAVQLLLAAAGRAAAPLGIRLPELSPGSRICVGGDVARADLRNPGLLDEWSWFPAGAAMELVIASDGSVSAVILEGRWDQRTAATARIEAGKLLFFAAGTRPRRAILTASGATPN